MNTDPMDIPAPKKRHRKPRTPMKPRIPKVRKPRRPKRLKKVRKPKKVTFNVLDLKGVPYQPILDKPVRPPRVRRPRIRKRRVRTRLVTLSFVYHSHRTGAYKFTEVAPNLAYDTLNDWTIKPGDLARVKWGECSDGLLRIDENLDNAVYLKGGYYPCTLDPSVTMFVWTPYVNQLKWKKLPTANQADLMTAFSELDDTIAMLGKNVIKSASYGGYKWGWSPLIGDIMAVNDCANNVKESYLDGTRRSSKYRAKHVIRKNSPIISHRGGKVRHEWEVSVSYKGTVTIENDVLAFYDYMGFHPSPKLFWDWVPLSFAVDYVLPIGDMLKQITPSKGWTKAANFTGWQVIHAVCKEVIVENPFHNGNRFLYEMPSPSQLFVSRTFVNNFALEQKTIPAAIDPFKVPTWEQAFDLSYLSEAFYNRGRKILSPHIYRKRR